AMALFTADIPLKSGIALCWASLLGLPIGLLAIGGGPCAGPRNLAGSLILLGLAFSPLARRFLAYAGCPNFSGRLAQWRRLWQLFRLCADALLSWSVDSMYSLV